MGRSNNPGMIPRDREVQSGYIQPCSPRVLDLDGGRKEIVGQKPYSVPSEYEYDATPK
ncbi:MAG: hypothetical protein AB1668_06905 [Nanoarchaeota archaeon]